MLRRCTLPLALCLASFLLVGVNSGCDNGGQPGGSASLSATPSTLQIPITGPGATVNCSLNVLSINNGAGGTIPAASLVFSSSNPTVAVATANPSAPNTIMVQITNPGFTTIGVKDPASGASTSVPVTVVAAGISGVLAGARTVDGFVGTLVNMPLPASTAAFSPIVSSASPGGPAGGSASLTVGAAAPITDILVGVAGQSGYLDINVSGSPATRQSPGIIGGYTVILNTLAINCSGQFPLSIVLKDAAGNFSQPTTISLSVTST